jgi:hypothetical protein
VEPIVGLILILAWGGVNALIAAKRGRSGLAFFCWSVLPVVPVITIMAKVSGGDGTIMGWAAFTCPLIAFIAAIMVKSGKEAAASSGAYGDYVRCPYCAEPVRQLAIKCRHCGSDLPEDDQD